MDRLKREGNPPVGQLASPIPQYKRPGSTDYDPVEGQHGAPFATLKDASGNVVSPATDAKLEQVRQLLTGVATENKLEQARVLLDTISTKDFATSSNQDALKTVVDDLKSELLLVKSELATIKANQLSGDQKVQLSGNIAELQTDLLATIAYNTGFGDAKISSWANVQHIVRAGLADKVFRIGDQFLAEFDGVPVVWDVIGINHDTPSNNNFTHSLTIQSHDCLVNAQFDAPEPNNPNTDRQQYGNGRYIHSAIKQWLNSNEETFQWVSQHEYDAPPTDTLYNGAGFLHLLDSELVTVLGAVDKQVARNTVTDGGGQDLFSDKVFLLSRVEAYGGAEGVVDGERVYPFYEAMASAATTAAIDERIKYLGSSARRWWLRSPYPGHAYYVRVVSPGGQVSYDRAYYSIGAAPACVIW